MKYAVDEINANQILLPGIKLGYEIHDTCRQSAVIVKPTMSYLTAKSDNMLAVRCNYTNYETRISAVVGPYGSEMVSVIGKLLGFFLMPQVCYEKNHVYTHCLGLFYLSTKRNVLNVNLNVNICLFD